MELNFKRRKNIKAKKQDVLQLYELIKARISKKEKKDKQALLNTMIFKEKQSELINNISNNNENTSKKEVSNSAMKQKLKRQISLKENPLINITEKELQEDIPLFNTIEELLFNLTLKERNLKQQIKLFSYFQSFPSLHSIVSENRLFLLFYSHFINYIELEKIQENKLIYSIGERCSDFYFILEGEFSVISIVKEQKELTENEYIAHLIKLKTLKHNFLLKKIMENNFSKFPINEHVLERLYELNIDNNKKRELEGEEKRMSLTEKIKQAKNSRVSTLHKLENYQDNNSSHINHYTIESEYTKVDLNFKYGDYLKDKKNSTIDKDTIEEGFVNLKSDLNNDVLTKRGDDDDSSFRKISKDNNISVKQINPCERLLINNNSGYFERKSFADNIENISKLNYKGNAKSEGKYKSRKTKFAFVFDVSDKSTNRDIEDSTGNKKRESCDIANNKDFNKLSIFSNNNSNNLSLKKSPVLNTKHLSINLNSNTLSSKSLINTKRQTVHFNSTNNILNENNNRSKNFQNTSQSVASVKSNRTSFSNETNFTQNKGYLSIDFKSLAYSDSLFNSETYVSNSYYKIIAGINDPYNLGLDELEKRIPIELYVYKEINKLKEGDYFGEYYKDKQSHINTVISNTECLVVKITKENYLKNLLIYVLEKKKTSIDFFLKNPIFKTFHYDKFDKLIFKMMQNKVLSQSEYLIKEFDCISSIYIIKNGSFEISFNKTFREILQLLPYYFPNENFIEQDLIDRIELDNTFEKFLDKKYTYNLVIYEDNEILGLSDFLYSEGILNSKKKRDNEEDSKKKILFDYREFNLEFKEYKEYYQRYREHIQKQKLNQYDNKNKFSVFSNKNKAKSNENEGKKDSVNKKTSNNNKKLKLKNEDFEFNDFSTLISPTSFAKKHKSNASNDVFISLFSVKCTSRTAEVWKVDRSYVEYIKEVDDAFSPNIYNYENKKKKSLAKRIFDLAINYMNEYESKLGNQDIETGKKRLIIGWNTRLNNYSINKVNNGLIPLPKISNKVENKQDTNFNMEDLEYNNKNDNIRVNKYSSLEKEIELVSNKQDSNNNSSKNDIKPRHNKVNKDIVKINENNRTKIRFNSVISMNNPILKFEFKNKKNSLINNQNSNSNINNNSSVRGLINESNSQVDNDSLNTVKYNKIRFQDINRRESILNNIAQKQSNNIPEIQLKSQLSLKPRFRKIHNFLSYNEEILKNSKKLAENNNVDLFFYNESVKKKIKRVEPIKKTIQYINRTFLVNEIKYNDYISIHNEYFNVNNAKKLNNMRKKFLNGTSSGSIPEISLNSSATNRFTNRSKNNKIAKQAFNTSNNKFNKQNRNKKVIEESDRINLKQYLEKEDYILLNKNKTQNINYNNRMHSIMQKRKNAKQEQGVQYFLPFEDKFDTKFKNLEKFDKENGYIKYSYDKINRKKTSSFLVDKEFCKRLDKLDLDDVKIIQ